LKIYQNFEIWYTYIAVGNTGCIESRHCEGNIQERESDVRTKLS